MDESFQAFRSAFFPFWRTITSISAMLASPLILVVLYVNGWNFVVPQILLIVLAALITPLLLFPAIAYFKIYVGKNGIKCYDFWGSYHYVEWPQVREIRPIRLLGLKYLRVYAEGFPRPLWVALDLAEIDRFVDLVIASAGPEHMLTEYLAGKRRFSS